MVAGCLFSAAKPKRMNIKGMVMDHLGFFAPHQLLNAVVALLVAALLGFMLGRSGGRYSAQEARGLAVWAALASLAVVFVRTNLPLAVALVALVMLVGARVDPFEGDRRVVLAAVVLGGACGAGAAIGAVALGIPFILLLRWARIGSSGN